MHSELLSGDDIILSECECWQKSQISLSKKFNCVCVKCNLIRMIKIWVCLVQFQVIKFLFHKMSIEISGEEIVCRFWYWFDYYYLWNYKFLFKIHYLPFLYCFCALNSQQNIRRRRQSRKMMKFGIISIFSGFCRQIFTGNSFNDI